MKTTLTHVNHACLLLEREGHYILTDPWAISPAFGNWVQAPSPPVSMIQRILSIEAHTICCVISHGHDDHCDDFFLRHHLSRAHIVINRFRAPGTELRLKQSADLVTSVPSGESFEFGPFRIRFLMNESFTAFDSIALIETDDEVFVHANDNWHEQPEHVINSIKAFNKQPYYFTQVGIADCFPLCYPPHTLEDVKASIQQRVRRYVMAAQSNARRLDLERIYAYANQSRLANVQMSLACMPYEEVQRQLQGTCVQQLSPGMQLDQSTCGASPNPPEPLFEYCLRAYQRKAQDYLRARVPEVTLLLGEEPGEPSEFPAIQLTCNRYVWSQIMTGKLNLEAITIGGSGLIFKHPLEYNMLTSHIALSSFGYIAQASINRRGLQYFLD